MGAAARGERKRQQRNPHHDNAGDACPGHEPVHRDNGGNHKDAERNHPVPRDCADGKPKEDVNDVRAADENEMNEALIHYLVRRQVVALRLFLDLDTGRTAEVLGVAPSTVKAHLARALSALRDDLVPARQQERSS